MNSLILAALIPALPNVELPYPETTTNIPIVVDMERLSTVSFSFDVSPSESNEVVLAVGCDTDGNGELSFDEAEIVFGCDDGERYIADLETGEVVSCDVDTIVFKQSDWKSGWNLVRIIKRGVGDVCESVGSDVENKKFVIKLR